jgi:hypothetical protein
MKYCLKSLLITSVLTVATTFGADHIAKLKSGTSADAGTRMSVQKL